MSALGRKRTFRGYSPVVTSEFDLDAEAESKLPVGFGCALVFPIAFWGTALIADYPGPPGPFGLLELVGWWGLCIFVSWVSALFFRRYRDNCARRYLQLLVAVGVPIVFGCLLYLDVQPETPAHVKRAVEYSLQVLGVPVLGMLAAFLFWIGWNSRR